MQKTSFRLAKKRGYTLIGVVVGALAFAACADDEPRRASDDDEDDPGGTTSGETVGAGGSTANAPLCNDMTNGESACGDVVCRAGSYCENEFFSSCDPGCVNEFDCAQGEYCERGGAGDVGVCVSCERSGNVDCAEECPARLVACGFDAELDVTSVCAQVCPGLTDEQVRCLREATCADLTSGRACGLSFGSG